MTAESRTLSGLRPLRFGIIPLSLAALLPTTRPAEAIPAFAAQTGYPCIQCHIGAYGPQLTPFGREFKMSGYTITGGEGWVSHVPIAIMVQPTFTNVAKSLPSGTSPGSPYGYNNTLAFDQVSLFIGGNIGEHSGAFIQGVTYSQDGNEFNWDNTDIVPYTTTFDIGDKQLRVGTTLNNNPYVQDPFNTTYAWSFPYISSKLAPTPTADVMLSTGFNQNAIGYTAYAWYDSSLYLEGGFYSSLSSWALGRVGNGFGIGNTVSPAPYLRAAYQWQWNDQQAHVGGTFMYADVNPTIDTFATSSAFGQDRYTDYSVDAGYQFLGDGTHIATAQAIYTHENQNLNGSTGFYNNANGTALGSGYNLNTFQANVSYWYKNTYGLTLGWQKSWGAANPVLYQTGEALSGSANGKPNSNDFIIEADWVPFGKEESLWRPLANFKIGVQYIAYTQFNGGTKNYDGFGRNAGDNNALMLFAWMIF